jgi:hypothetical protein
MLLATFWLPLAVAVKNQLCVCLIVRAAPVLLCPDLIGAVPKQVGSKVLLL